MRDSCHYVWLPEVRIWASDPCEERRHHLAPKIDSPRPFAAHGPTFHIESSNRCIVHKTPTTCLSVPTWRDHETVQSYCAPPYSSIGIVMPPRMLPPTNSSWASRKNALLGRIFIQHCRSPSPTSQRPVSRFLHLPLILNWSVSLAPQSSNGTDTPSRVSALLSDPLTVLSSVAVLMHLSLTINYLKIILRIPPITLILRDQQPQPRRRRSIAKLRRKQRHSKSRA